MSPQRPHLQNVNVVEHDGDTVELRTGVWNVSSITLTDPSGSGRLYDIILKFDGEHTTADISQLLHVPLDVVETIHDRLSELRLLREGGAGDSFIELTSPVLSTYAGQRPAESHVVILGAPDLAQQLADLCRRALPAATFETTDDKDERLSWIFDTSDNWLNDGLATERAVQRWDHWRNALFVSIDLSANPLRSIAINRLACRLGASTIHGIVDGPFIFIGPTVIPKRTACFECFETRVTMNLRNTESYLKYKRALTSARRSRHDRMSPVVAAILLAHLSLEVVNVCTTGWTYTAGKVLGLFVPAMEFSFNEILRVPGCGTCGSLYERDGRELYFDSVALTPDDI